MDPPRSLPRTGGRSWPDGGSDRLKLAGLWAWSVPARRSRGASALHDRVGQRLGQLGADLAQMPDPQPTAARDSGDLVVQPGGEHSPPITRAHGQCECCEVAPERTTPLQQVRAAREHPQGIGVRSAWTRPIKRSSHRSGLTTLPPGSSGSPLLLCARHEHLAAAARLPCDARKAGWRIYATRAAPRNSPAPTSGGPTIWPKSGGPCTRDA